jgi:hypothetical protein
MVDWIAILVSHGLLAFAFWRLLWRDDLDDEAAPPHRHRPPGYGQTGTVVERPEAKPHWPSDA